MAIKGTFQFPELAAKPSAPPVGAIILYVKTDNVLYIQDSTGTEYAFGSASFISALHGDVTATGPGDAAAVVNSIGGSSAANVHAAELLANAATALNTNSAIVRRDGSGNFAANVASLNALKLLGSVSGTAQIAAPSTFSDFTLILPNGTGSAGQSLTTDGTGILSWSSVLTTSLADGKIFVGNSSNIATPRTPGGDVSMTNAGLFTVNSVGTSSAANIHTAELLANAATALATPNAIVKRDGSGGFAATAIAINSLISTGTSDMVQAIIKGFTSQTNDIFQVLKSDNSVLFKVDNSGNGTFLGNISAANFSGSSTGSNTGDVTLAPVGAVPNANAASLVGQVLTLQPANGTNPGVISILAQSIAGIKTFLSKILVSDTTQSTDKDTGSIITEGGLGVEKNINAGGAIAASNFSGSSSGTNTGDASFGPVGTTPNANGGDITGQVITLEPADGTHPGVLSILAQSIAGIKTFLSKILISDTTQSTDKDTGSLITEGGIGVEKNINAGGNIAAANFSGSSSGANTGDVSLTPVGTSPNANAASLAGQALTLQPADGTNPGILSILAQSIAGIKTFLSKVLVSDTTQSTDKDTGSIVTEGGVGIEKNLNVGGNAAVVGTISASNFSGSSSGTNTGDVTKTDTDSIALVLAAQNISANLRLSTDAATVGSLKATATIHSGAGAGLHIEYPFATPVNVGTSNNSGSNSAFALSDHVHAITSATVLGLLLTGYTAGSNTPIAATDSFLTAFRNLQAQITAGVGANITSLTGDVTGTGPGATATTISVGAVTDTKASLAVKPALTVVATTNQTLSGTPTIDGQATTAGTSSVLLTAQTTASENGPWMVQSGAWTRPTWYPNGGTTQAFQFITVFIRLGTVYGGSTWRQTAAAPITIGTTTTTWAVTPVKGNFNSIYTVGLQSGVANVDLVFANALTGTLRWNPTVSHVLTLPATQGAAGTSLVNDGTGILSWSNLNTNIDGGRPDSVYTPSQFINGGTP